MKAILLVALAMPAFSEIQLPKELLEYVREAQKLGLNEQAIRQNAIGAGWDAKLTDSALAAVKRGDIAPSPAVNLPEGYRIGAGDVLQVSVFKEPDASVPAIVVRSDGRVSLPLIREVEIGGMTAAEAEKMLNEKYARFITDAEVTLVVREINSRKVYVMGAVHTVGAISLRSSLTVLQALTLAGGLTDYAKRKQIYILRNEKGTPSRLKFDYSAVIRGEHMEQNVLLQPDDTIIVPQ